MKIPENLLKLNISGYMPTDTVYKKYREENKPHLQILRRNTLTSTSDIL